MIYIKVMLKMLNPFGCGSLNSSPGLILTDYSAVLHIYFYNRQVKSSIMSVNMKTHCWRNIKNIFYHK